MAKGVTGIIRKNKTQYFAAFEANVMEAFQALPLSSLRPVHLRSGAKTPFIWLLYEQMSKGCRWSRVNKMPGLPELQWSFFGS